MPEAAVRDDEVPGGDEHLMMLTAVVVSPKASRQSATTIGKKNTTPVDEQLTTVQYARPQALFVPCDGQNIPFRHSNIAIRSWTVRICHVMDCGDAHLRMPLLLIMRNLLDRDVYRSYMRNI